MAGRMFGVEHSNHELVSMLPTVSVEVLIIPAIDLSVAVTIEHLPIDDRHLTESIVKNHDGCAADSMINPKTASYKSCEEAPLR